MIYTSAEASKLLKKLENERHSLEYTEMVTREFVASICENVEDARPSYNYEETAAKLDEVNRKIRKIKHALNVFNTTTVIPEFGITIDEMLVLMPQLTTKKRKLEDMALTMPKSRKENSISSSSNIEYSYANYDIAKVKKDALIAEDTLAKAQIALDSINHSATLEIDI